MSRYGLDDEPEDEGSIIVSQNNCSSNENGTWAYKDYRDAHGMEDFLAGRRA